MVYGVFPTSGFKAGSGLIVWVEDKQNSVVSGGSLACGA